MCSESVTLLVHQGVQSWSVLKSVNRSTAAKHQKGSASPRSDLSVQIKSASSNLIIQNYSVIYLFIYCCCPGCKVFAEEFHCNCTRTNIVTRSTCCWHCCPENREPMWMVSPSGCNRGWRLQWPVGSRWPGNKCRHGNYFQCFGILDMCVQVARWAILFWNYLIFKTPN